MNIRHTYLFIFPALLLLSGCFKTYDFVSSEFPQAPKQEPLTSVITRWRRSVKLYDGFTTKASIDALWKTDELCLVYTSLHSERVGMNPEEREAFLLRQLEENNHWLTFYLLAEIADEGYTSFTDTQSGWSLYLELPTGERIAPESIREVEISPEIRALFGPLLTPFKKRYCVRFPAKTLASQVHLAPGDEVHLICAGPATRAQLQWTCPAGLAQAAWDDAYALKTQAQKGMFSFFKDLAKPKAEDQDFFW